jgi:uncharacterized protein (DUF3084 family)
MLTTTIGERDRLRKELGSAAQQFAAMREQIESGEWVKGLTSTDRLNYQLTEQNRHLQDKVLRLSTSVGEPPPF